MFTRLGSWALRLSVGALEVFLLPYVAFKGAWLERGKGRRLVLQATASQIYYTAGEPLPLFLLLGALMGFFLLVIADRFLRPNGLSPQIPTLVSTVGVGQVIPLLVTLILVGRSGTAISTELGAMRVMHEVEALEVAGVNIEYFLVAPRLLGVTLAALILTTLTSACSITLGFLLTQLTGVVGGSLGLGTLLRALTPLTLLIVLLKAALSGMTIAAVNCREGLLVERTVQEIPRANIRGAMQSYALCLLVHGSLSASLFWQGGF